MTTRRTVLLNLPLSVQAEECRAIGGLDRRDRRRVDGTRGRRSGPRGRGAPRRRGARLGAAGLRGRTRRPAVRRRAAGRRGPLRRAAGRVGRRQGPVPTGEQWSLGVSGGFASPLAAELIGGADLIVGWGCALNMWTMRHGKLIAPGATVVQVDDTADALGAHRALTFGVLGDVGLTARALARRSCLRARTGYRTDHVRRRLSAGAPLAPRAVRRPHRRRAHRPAHPHHRARRPPPPRADRGGRLGQLHGLPGDVPRHPRRTGLLLHPGLPVDRAGPGDRHRCRARAPGPAPGRRPRRRRRADVGRGAGDRRPARAADARRGLRRPRVRRRGAPLRTRRRTPSTPWSSPTRTSRRSRAASGSTP